MDYDADGRIDIVTGSYTGQFYLFRRQPDGSFAQRALFQDESGGTLWMPFDKRIYSVTPELVDMDADGDLDLVVGNRGGAVQVVDNIGTRSKPVWSKAHRALTTTAGEDIEGSNAHHADWDGDGIRDLVVGSERGEVRWYRNTGANDAPRYAAGEVLLPNSNDSIEPEGTVPTGPGLRVKVHVTDWDADGRVDLLVGDVTGQQKVTNPLTAEEEKAKEALELAYRRLLDQQEAATDASVKAAIETALAEVRAKLGPLDRLQHFTHGWVWLYRRADAARKPGR